jgi:hypothetical protein
VSFAVTLGSPFPLRFTTGQKWIRQLLASTPKFVRLLLRTGAE